MNPFSQKFSEIKVLILEESRAMQKILLDSFLSLGFKVSNIEQTNDPKKALSLLEQKPVNIITTDFWTQASFDLAEFVQRIRNHSNFDVRNSFVLFISEDRGNPLSKSYQEVGANAFLPKPFKDQELLSVLRLIPQIRKQTHSRIQAHHHIIEKFKEGMGVSIDSLEGKKLLLIENSPESNTIFKEAFQPFGIEILEAHSGETALKIFAGNTPELVLIEIDLPGMDGFEICRRIKKNQLLQDIPVIFITHDATAETIVQAYKAGGVDYILKPYKHEELIGRVQTHLRLTSALREQQDLIKNLTKLQKKKDMLIEELLDLKEKLEFSAKTDPLTGLYNRRGAQELIDQEISRCQRSEQPFCVVLADIDNFKTVNDTYGHQFGDEVLKEMGMIFRSQLRLEDIVARWGGEEFLILLPQTELKSGKQVAEKLRQSIESYATRYNGHSVRCTMSMGIASNNQNLAKMDQIVKLADELLYQAKQTGKNKVISL